MTQLLRHSRDHPALADVGGDNGRLNHRPADSELKAWLGRVAAAAGQPDGPICARARRSHTLKSIQIERPTLAVVLSGSQRLRGEGSDVSMQSGDVFLVTRAGRFDTVNAVPALGGGPYVTVCAALCDEVLAAVRLLWHRPIRSGSDAIIRHRAGEVRAELVSWCTALMARDVVAARLALAAVLLRFCEAGHDAFLAPPIPTVAERVRQLIAAKPALTWNSSAVESALGMSGATLRRRLAGEGTTLREQLVEARLARALELLLTTNWPVKTIAAQVGYRSASSFAQRFSQRFGLAPSEIGN